MEIKYYKELIENTYETNNLFFREVEDKFDIMEKNRALIQSKIPIELYNYLVFRTDFFIAPASTRYHDCNLGGLAQHSINVVNHLLKLVKDYNLKYNEKDIWLIGIAHDICKVNCYKPAVRNVKTNGQWNTVMNWEYQDDEPMGHGEKSVWMLNKQIKVEDDIAYAIRWHMGAFRDNNGGRFECSDAFAKSEIAMLTHIADMLATYKGGLK